MNEHDDDVEFERRHEATVTLLQKDIDQDQKIDALEKKLLLAENAKGTLKLADLSKLGGIMALLFALMTGLSSMWLQSKTEPTRQELALLVQDVQGMDAIVRNRGRELDDVERRAVEGSRTLFEPVRNDMARIVADLAKQEEELDELRGAIAETLDQEVLAQQFQAQDLKIDAVQGQFDRIISARLQPQIDRHETILADIGDSLVSEIIRQRDRLETLLEDAAP